MYKMPDLQMSLEDFVLPFDGKLCESNRWVELARKIPWGKMERRYAQLFSSTGNPAKPLRTALGALIIKAKYGFSDEETVREIQENPYLQYFIGLKEFNSQPPFHPSLMVLFRRRIPAEVLDEIGALIGCNIRKIKHPRHISGRRKKRKAPPQVEQLALAAIFDGSGTKKKHNARRGEDGAEAER